MELFKRGGTHMTLEKSCKYYLNSRCILGGGYCDLNCNQLLSDEEFRLFDEADTFTPRWMREGKEAGDSEEHLS
jgi:hypothetical protein